MFADEDGTGVADPGRHLSGVACLDLQVLRRVGIRHLHRLVEITHQQYGRLLSCQRSADTLPVPCLRHLALQFTFHSLSEGDRVRDQDGGSHRVVLRLRDQVGRDISGVRGGVCDDGDFGWACLGVDANDSPQQALRRHHVDVSRARDHRHWGTEALDPMGEHRNGLGTTDGIDLGDPQQMAERKNVRVWPPAGFGLGR